MADDPWAKYNMQPAPAASAPPGDDWSKYNMQPAPAAAASGGGWQDAVGSNLDAFGKLIARTGARTLLGPADLLAQGIRIAHDKYTGETTTLPSMTDSAIDAMRSQMDPDAGVAMRGADFIAPWLVPTPGGGLSRIREAPGLINKVGEGLRYVAGAGVDAAASTGAAEVAKDSGAGDLGTMIAGLIGAGARPLASRGAGKALQLAAAAPDAREVFDATKALGGKNGPTPSFGMVAGPGGKQIEKTIGAIPIVGAPIDAARSANYDNIQSGVGKALGDLAGQNGPITGPADENAIGMRIINNAQAKNRQMTAEASANQDWLENQIGSDRPVDVSPLIQEMTKLTASPTTGTASAKAIAPRIDDLQTLVGKQNQPLTGQAAADYLAQAAATPEQWNGFVSTGQVTPTQTTAAYGGLKEDRADLGRRIGATEPIPGAHLGQVYGHYTDAMRNAAVDAGVDAGEFDRINEQYRSFIHEQQPFLEEQGGEIKGGRALDAPMPGTVAGRAEAGVRVNQPYLDSLAQNIDPGTARGTVADVISRMGRMQTGGPFRTDRFARDWGPGGEVSDSAKKFIGAASPEAASTLQNAATAGKGMDLAPEQNGVTKSVTGAILANAALAPFLHTPAAWATAPLTIPGVVGGLESPSVTRAMARRADIPALLAQYAYRAGLTGDQQQQAPPWR